MSKSLTTQSRQHSYEERGNDLYETPTEATRALLANVKLPRHVWEPACGRGAISKELERSGHIVLTSDLVQYDGMCGYELDFLSTSTDNLVAAKGYSCIVTNPPYKHAAKFVRKALSLHHVEKVCMLLRLAFLESVGRTDILDYSCLAQVLVFKDRLPMMHRDGWEGPKVKSGAIPFAWFIWDKTHKGTSIVQRISWKDYTNRDK